MKKLKLTSAIQPKKLTAIEKDQLSDRLYAVHSQIFDGTDQPSFRRYVIEPDTLLTKIFIFQNQQKEDVGYITFQVFEAEVKSEGASKKPLIFRTEVGLLPSYRGAAKTLPLLVREIAAFYIKNLFRESYFLATPVHPIPYHIAHSNLKYVYPRPEISTPKHILDLMQQLSGSLGISSVPGSGPYTKKVGWIVKCKPEYHRRLKVCTQPGIRFYLEQNPDFHQGNGLMMLVPIGISNGISAVSKMFRKKIHRRGRKIRLQYLKPVATALTFGL